MTTPTLVLEVLVIRFTLIVLLSRMIITKNEWTCLHILLQLFNYLGTLSKTSIFPASQNQVIQENIFSNAPYRRVAVAMNTNSAITGSYAESPFCYEQFGFRYIRILRGGQLILDFDSADKSRLFVTTMKAMNFQDDIPSILFYSSEDHSALGYDLMSKQDATENCLCPELVGVPLRMEPKIFSPSDYWTYCIGKKTIFSCN